VSVIDTASNAVTAQIPVGSNPLGIAITPDGRTAYVTDFSDDTVHVIDTATQAVTTTVNVGNGPLGIAITPDGRSVYVANRQPFNFPDTGDMSVIDTAQNAVVATIPVGSNPTGVAVVAPTTGACPGDCNGDGTVTINEILLSVNIVLGSASVGQCPAADLSGDGSVTVNELLAVVTASLNGCPR
jgi:YVTN family beta-propeller protein